MSRNLDVLGSLIPGKMRQFETQKGVYENVSHRAG